MWRDTELTGCGGRLAPSEHGEWGRSRPGGSADPVPVGGPGGGLAWGKGTPSSLLEAQSAWPWRRPAGPRGRRRGAAGLRGNSCRQRAGPPRAPVPRFNCCFPASPEHPVLAFGALRREPHGRPVSGGSSGGSPPVCAPSCPSGSHVGGTGLGVTETQRGTCPSVSWTRVLVTAKDALGLPGASGERRAETL